MTLFWMQSSCVDITSVCVYAGRVLFYSGDGMGGVSKNYEIILIIIMSGF